MTRSTTDARHASTLLLIAVLLAALLPGCGRTSEPVLQIPDWIIGTWTGAFGFEHEPVEYAFVMKLEKNGKGTLTLSGRGASFRLTMESASPRQVRYKMTSDDPDADAIVSPGIMDLIRLPEQPQDVIHVQFYPAGKEELWLGRARRMK